MRPPYQQTANCDKRGGRNATFTVDGWSCSGEDEAGEKRVGPGDFLRVPGGHKHWSGGDKKEGALFYEEASGKFDLIPAN